jgi:hypothetical protein
VYESLSAIHHMISDWLVQSHGQICSPAKLSEKFLAEDAVLTLGAMSQFVGPR